MAGRKILVVFLAVLAAMQVKGQDDLYGRADSLTSSLYNSGQWDLLLRKGRSFLKEGADFGDLRLRLGYACLMKGNYGEAIKHLGKVVSNDSHNQAARYFLYLAHSYLNHDVLAAGQKAYVGQEILKSAGFSLYSAELESSYKISRSGWRGNGWYNRAGLSAVLFRRLLAEQSLSFFRQDIYRQENWVRTAYPDRQTEYFFRLSYPASPRLALSAACHYLFTNFAGSRSGSHVLSGGITYAGGLYDLGFSADAGTILREALRQYNAKLLFYPLGNLNLYTVSRISWHKTAVARGLIVNQTAGFKAAERLWLESSVTAGRLNNYIDADGLYIYNAIDDTRLKLGESAYRQFNSSVLLQISYFYEKKRGESELLDYGQHAITAGIVWKF